MTLIDSYISYAPSQKPGVGCQASPDDNMAFVAAQRSRETDLIGRSTAGMVARMLHLIKVSVGVRDLAHLAALQRERAEINPPLRHWTRQTPKRAGEIIDGGSIFWVIAGIVQCRQRVLDITPDQRPDGARCVALRLDPAIVLVNGRPMRPFQGWRYLEADAAPPDAGEGASSEAELPMALRLALVELCLL